MTVAPAVAESVYALVGTALGPFNTVFPYAAAADVAVYVDFADGNGPILQGGGNYTLTDLVPLSTGGRVTLSAALPGTAWAAGATLMLKRATPSGQPSAFGELSPFSPAASEAALDELARQVQDVKATLARALVFGPGMGGLNLGRNLVSKLLGTSASGAPFLYDIDAVGGASTAALVDYTVGAGTPTRTLQEKLLEVFDFQDWGGLVGDIDGNGAHNSAVGAAISAAVNAAGGGIVVVPAGVYRWGSQVFAGAAGKGYAYQGQHLFYFQNCTAPVIVRFEGVVMRSAGGQRFGAFNPATGAVVAGPTTNADDQAWIGDVVIATGCASLAIEGACEFDGNINAMIIGGQWGDTGIQLPHIGVLVDQCKQVKIDGPYCHHFGLDGIGVSWTGLTLAADPYPHRISNVRSLYNGRQGLSVVGCNQLVIENCTFAHTGKNGVVNSAPAAGVDIEAESFNRNITLINPRIFDNSGVGLVADTGDSRDIHVYGGKIEGNTNWAIWPNKARFSFSDTLFAGPVVRLYAAAAAQDGTKFSRCRFTMDATFATTGALYANPSDLTTGTFAVFDDCDFDSGAQPLPNCASGAGGVTWRDCRFTTTAAVLGLARGRFQGHCAITYGAGGWSDGGTGVYEGRLEENGVVSTHAATPAFTQAVSLRNNNGGGVFGTTRLGSWYDPTSFVAFYGNAAIGDIVTNCNYAGAGQTLLWVCKTAPGNVIGDWNPLVL